MHGSESISLDEFSPDGNSERFEKSIVAPNFRIQSRI